MSLNINCWAEKVGNSNDDQCSQWRCAELLIVALMTVVASLT
jgi:hypothetical protein